jgi:hypothetical protein
VPRADGRVRAPYDPQTFFRAVTIGRDVSDQLLATTMPRFELTQAECADLVAYLKAVDAGSDEGVGTDLIRLGLAVPARSTQRTAAEVQLLQAWAEGVNARGGIFRRRIEWVRVDPAAGRVLPAVVAMYVTDGAESTVVADCERRQVPHLQCDASGDVPSRYGFAFLPDALTRTLLLVRHVLADQPTTGGRAAVLCAPGFPRETLRERLGRATNPSGMRVLPFTDGAAMHVARDLAATSTRQVVLAGRLAQFQSLLVSGEARNGRVTFLCADPDAPSVIRSARVRLFTLRCAGETDLSPDAAAEVRQSTSNKTALDDDACAVLTAVRLLEFALENAGREVGREKLRDSLEALSEVRTGFAPPTGFTSRRHIAAAGMYLVPLVGAEDAHSVWLPFGS